MAKIRLALLDANIVYLDAISRVLSLHDEFHVLYSVQTMNELRHLMEHDPPDIVIADLDFYTASDPFGANLILEIYPDVRFLFMGFDLPVHMIRKRKDEARVSFLPKDLDISLTINRLIYISSYCGSSSRWNP
jgi:DNA-binding NarL/FixJ family response regulator